MKKIIGFLAIIIVLAACEKDQVPDGVIEKPKMINVLFDMHITDAYLNAVNNRDTLLMQAHSRYNYIFKKFEIDSVAFTKSLNFYSKYPKQLNEIYTAVSDSILRVENDLKAKASVASLAKFNYLFYKYTVYQPGGNGIKEFYTENYKRNITQKVTDTVNLKSR